MSIIFSVRLIYIANASTTAPPILSLHDALPISFQTSHGTSVGNECLWEGLRSRFPAAARRVERSRHPPRRPRRSEEHTSELQSPCNVVCRLLLEKKNLGTVDWIDEDNLYDIDTS